MICTWSNCANRADYGPTVARVVINAVLSESLLIEASNAAVGTRETREIAKDVYQSAIALRRGSYPQNHHQALKAEASLSSYGRANGPW